MTCDDQWTEEQLAAWEAENALPRAVKNEQLRWFTPLNDAHKAAQKALNQQRRAMLASKPMTREQQIDEAVRQVAECYANYAGQERKLIRWWVNGGPAMRAAIPAIRAEFHRIAQEA